MRDSRDTAGHPETIERLSRPTIDRKRDRTGHTPIGVSYCPDVLSRDFVLLTEREFLSALQSYTTLAELEGMANRRRVLSAPQLERWKPWQREMIMRRKWELENGL